MAPVIDVHNVTFRYENRAILDDINFSIECGTFFSIIGPNGSGKTTLLKNISYILPPEKGTIMINGRDLKSYRKRELARNVAYVSQNTQSDFEFTVMDVVLMGRAPYLKPFESESLKDVEIASECMKLTGVFDLKDKKITEISGGERQRVQISCALAQKAGILLLDEPVSNLDIQYQVSILGMLKTLKEQKAITVVTVLHDLNLAAEYSDEIMLMKDGRVLKSGTPSEVLNEQNIKEAYKTDVYITQNPISGKPHIIPIRTVII